MEYVRPMHHTIAFYNSELRERRLLAHCLEKREFPVMIIQVFVIAFGMIFELELRKFP